mmetsp:Transcript_46420/g.88633  ORF Transcript_46420/g.88633 Transcript_46420/m.88633 type:complete len:208 (-) Transcript_46420:268-891(-)
MRRRCISSACTIRMRFSLCCWEYATQANVARLSTPAHQCSIALARAQRSLFPISCMPVHPAHVKILKAPTLYASAFCSLARLRCPQTTRSRQPIRVLRSQCSRQNPAAFTLRTLCVPSSRATSAQQSSTRRPRQIAIRVLPSATQFACAARLHLRCSLYARHSQRLEARTKFWKRARACFTKADRLDHNSAAATQARSALCWVLRLC